MHLIMMKSIGLSSIENMYYVIYAIFRENYYYWLIIFVILIVINIY